MGTMRATHLTAAILLGGFVGFAWCACSAEGEEKDKPAGPPKTTKPKGWDPDAKRLALLVGIQDYPQPEGEDFDVLEGPINDVKLMRETLVERLEFPAENVVVLMNKEATFENIVTSFTEHLIARADESTEVLYFYSGHGSFIKDASLKEENEQDSTFVAYDSRVRSPLGGYDITDDAMYSLVSALKEKTQRITLITDACYSGGGMRGGGFKGGSVGAIRSLPKGDESFDPKVVENFWPRDIPFLDDDTPQRQGLDRHYVHIAACSNRQVARDWKPNGYRDEDGRQLTYGALTFFLIEVLRQAKPTDSYREIAARTAVLVANARLSQSVWIEGDMDRQLFGSRFSPPPTGFFVSRRQNPDQLFVGAGRLHGLDRGSLLQVLAEGKPVGTAEVLKAFAGKSLARWKTAREDLNSALPLRARELSAPTGLPPLTIYLDPEAAKLAKEKWFSDLIGDGLIQQATRAEAAYVLSRSAHDGEIRLTTAEGLQVYSVVGADFSPGRFRDKVLWELRLLALWGLATPFRSRDYELEVKFVPPTAEQLRCSPSGVSWSKSFADARLELHSTQKGRAAHNEYLATLPEFQEHKGRMSMLRIENQTFDDLHVAVLSLGENREIGVLWPPEGERDQLLKGDDSIDVPVSLGADPNWSLPRPMRERYLVVATQKYVDFHPFERESALEEPRAPLRGAGPGAPLPHILQLALAASRTRGANEGTDKESKQPAWGVTWVDLLIEPSK